LDNKVFWCFTYCEC